MLHDTKLLGVPLILVIGELNLDNDQVELKNRRKGEKQLLDIDGAVAAIVAELAKA